MKYLACAVAKLRFENLTLKLRREVKNRKKKQNGEVLQLGSSATRDTKLY